MFDWKEFVRLRIAPAFLSVGLLGTMVHGETPEIYFQAHRGGLDEVPENTLAAVEYAWGIPGAVPEVDIRTTQDGILVCIHDKTPERTLSAPNEWADKSIREIPYSLLKSWDAGSYFDATYSDAKVPTLSALLEKLAARPESQLYLDLKDVENAAVVAMIMKYKVSPQIIFVHGSPKACLALSKSWPGARTMTWLSGPPAGIKSRFRNLAESGFEGIDQIQLHLKPDADEVPGKYQLGAAFLQEAVDTAQASGTTLQVRPFIFDTKSLRALIDMKIHWYVADAPGALRKSIEAALVK